MTRERTITLSDADLELVIEALDSHEYWQLGYDLPRKDGLVFVPGDREPDLIWEGREPTSDERACIDAITDCRALRARLESLAADLT